MDQSISQALQAENSLLKLKMLQRKYPQTSSDEIMKKNSSIQKNSF